MPDDAPKQHHPRRRVASNQHRARQPHAPASYRTALALLLTLAVPIARAAPPATKPATRPVVNSPAATAVRQFHDALKADRLDAAKQFLAATKDPVRDADRRVTRLAQTLATARSDFSVVDARIAGDCAVVLINDHLKDGRKTIDIKPWYLRRQNDHWKLLPKFTDFELKEYGLDEAQLNEYRKLETWANQREPQLRKEQPDCGC